MIYADLDHGFLADAYLDAGRQIPHISTNSKLYFPFELYPLSSIFGCRVNAKKSSWKGLASKVWYSTTRMNNTVHYSKVHASIAMKSECQDHFNIAGMGLQGGVVYLS
jgi:hypothetical protein